MRFYSLFSLEMDLAMILYCVAGVCILVLYPVGRLVGYLTYIYQDYPYIEILILPSLLTQSEARTELEPSVGFLCKRWSSILPSFLELQLSVLLLFLETEIRFSSPETNMKQCSFCSRLHFPFKMFGPFWSV